MAGPSPAMTIYTQGALSRLGNSLHAAPGFERRPDAALEPETVDRRRRMDGADAVEADAGPLEAALLQHPARGRIGDARARLQCVVRQVGEGVVDHRVQRLGGVAVAPI